MQYYIDSIIKKKNWNYSGSGIILSSASIVTQYIKLFYNTSAHTIMNTCQRNSNSVKQKKNYFLWQVVCTCVFVYLYLYTNMFSEWSLTVNGTTKTNKLQNKH